MRVGAHVSSSGGLTTAFERAGAIGAETIQIFGAPPQVWRRRKIRPEECEAFRAGMAETDIQPVFLHGVYLINLATANPEQLKKSSDALAGDLNLASAIGAKGVIFHVGSHKGAGFDQVLPQIVETLQSVLKETPDDAWIILENSAGMGGSVGSKFSELGAIMKAVDSPRLQVCLDTEHAYAAGYNLAEQAGIDEAMAEFEREVGVRHLVAVHANDSKIELGGGVDRHDNIGEGHIGREGFEVIMAHQAFADVPFLLEVPGFEKDGPDKPNIDILKEIRAKVEAD
ncbi:MAG: deoxyribonuclease IV [Chloroflexi bacterium]|nr:deoxyribonuclease IV [Chloroflexota bacterium]